MKKQLLSVIALGAAVVANAQIPIITKSFSGGIKDAAIDTNGNLFVIAGDGESVSKIDHNGNVVWTDMTASSLGVYSSIGVDSLGRVNAAVLLDDHSIGFLRLQGWTGGYDSWINLAEEPDEVYDMACSDQPYLAYRIGADTKIASASGTVITVNSNSAPLTLAPVAAGGLLVGVRDSTHLYKRYDTTLSQVWSFSDFYTHAGDLGRPTKMAETSDGRVLTSRHSGVGDFIGYVLNLSDGAYQTGFRTSGKLSITQAQVVAPFLTGSTYYFVRETAASTTSIRVDSMSLNLNWGVNPGGAGVHLSSRGSNVLAAGSVLQSYTVSGSLLSHGSWTKPTGEFKMLPRPDGTFWCVELGSTPTSLIRIGSGSKAVKDFFVMYEDDATATFNVLANDMQDTIAGAMTAEWGSFPSTIGAVSNENANGSFQFTPGANQSGAFDFTYQMRDGDGVLQAPVPVRIVVKPVNDRPEGGADSYSIGRNQLLTVDQLSGVLDNDTDADGHNLTAHLHRIPQRGSLNLANDGSFTYQAPAQPGTYTFQYRAQDVKLYSTPTTVTITVN